MEEKLKQIFKIIFDNSNSPVSNIIDNMFNVIIDFYSIENSNYDKKLDKLKNLIIEKINAIINNYTLHHNLVDDSISFINDLKDVRIKEKTYSNTINKFDQYRLQIKKDSILNNKESIKKRNKNYREQNKESIKEKAKNYRE